MGFSNLAGVELQRPADATPYTIGDGIGVNLALNGATNATPIVISTNSVAHNLADGDPITISSVGGNTNANGNFYAKVTGQDSSHAALYSDYALTQPVAGNGNYTSGGALARCWRFPGIFRAKNLSGYIVKVKLKSDNAAFSLQTRAHIFKLPLTSPPSLPLDNAAWSPNYTGDNWVGSVDLPALFAPSGAQSGAAATAIWLGQMAAVATPDTPDLIVVLQALTASTPGSASKQRVEVTLDQNTGN